MGRIRPAFLYGDQTVAGPGDRFCPVTPSFVRNGHFSPSQRTMLLHSRSMWSISAIPLYLWCMLLLPSAGVAIYVAVRRRWAYVPILSFSLATVVASIAESVYTVFVLKRFDEKFRHAPSVAVEISFFGDAVIGFIALLLFGGTVAFYARGGRQETARSVVVAALFGGIYATGPNVLY